MNLAFRPATSADDRIFLVSTWSRSFKLSHSAGLISSESWPHVMHPELERILDRDGVRAVIACERDDPDYFYGWAAGDTSGRTPVLYYVYVKEPFRRTGVARRLFAAIGIDPSQYFIYVCRGPSYRQVASRYPLAKYNPNEVRFPKETT